MGTSIRRNQGGWKVGRPVGRRAVIQIEPTQSPYAHVAIREMQKFRKCQKD